jgi:hypothetical protein
MALNNAPAIIIALMESFMLISGKAIRGPLKFYGSTDKTKLSNARRHQVSNTDNFILIGWSAVTPLRSAAVDTSAISSGADRKITVAALSDHGAICRERLAPA